MLHSKSFLEVFQRRLNLLKPGINHPPPNPQSTERDPIERLLRRRWRRLKAGYGARWDADKRMIDVGLHL